MAVTWHTWALSLVTWRFGVAVGSERRGGGFDLIGDVACRLPTSSNEGRGKRRGMPMDSEWCGCR